MSDRQACKSSGQTGTDDITDVLLVVDTVTLLKRCPDAGDDPANPTPVDGDCCYGIASGIGQLQGINEGQLCIEAPIGACLRLRWAPLAMRAEYAVLLSLELSDEQTFGHARLIVDEQATSYVPQSATPMQPARRSASDYFWQIDVKACGTVEATINALVTDRDARILGSFQWPLHLSVTSAMVG
ncbi:AidA/PixA family protein [Cupriavidus sp. UYPR2.512]|uniref:AidA/PixA family protein n=1 Tax=Cupriavidus sp. UYPR2.512 TaxID=1080187 RepID=UPI00037490BF|nr:AidA/PixA family protein [Cupriavidus sp. UYPR2.512]UIF88985.1 hypothetical protein KAF44_27690 [Cupriavidus necator]